MFTPGVFNRLRRARTTSAAAFVGLAGLAVLGGAVVTSNGSSGHTHAAPVAVEFHPTQVQLDAWKAETATPFQRAQMIMNLQHAFAGVADVGFGSLPSSAQVNAAQTTPSATVNEVVAYGVSGDHFWIIASYADISRGAIWGAVAVCDRYAPSWICSGAGNMLDSWAAGWGSANSHGVWAAIYWWPPHVTGGRW